MRTFFASLVLFALTSSAVAEPATIHYRRQELRSNSQWDTTVELELTSAELVGDILLPNAFRYISTWRPVLRQNEIGTIYKLTAADPEFAGFAEAAPGLVHCSHFVLMAREGEPGTNLSSKVLSTGNFWEPPSIPYGATYSPPFPLVLNRVEIELVQYSTNPLGAIVQWDVRLIGTIPEPATAGLMLMLCIGLLHVRRR